MIPFGFMKSASATFNPATLTLTAWQRGSYAGSPWTPTASAGSSGSNGNWTEATNPPSTGVTLDGFTVVDCDGTNDLLSNSNTLGTFITATRWWSSILFKVDSFTTNAAAYYDNAAIVCEGNAAGNYWGFHVKGTGASGSLLAAHFDSGAKSVAATISTATWYHAVAYYDGTNINLILNGVAQTPTAANSVGDTSLSPMRIGRNYTTAFFDGKLAELMIAGAAAYGASEAASARSYTQARYPSAGV